MNQTAILAAKDERVRERLIRQQEQTILRTASVSCRRFITKSDDEWSIALCAFSRAIDQYTAGKSDFLPFAQMLIKRDLIDYFRTQKRTAWEVTVSPQVLEGNAEPDEAAEEHVEGVYHAVVQASAQAAERSLQEEIIAINDQLQPFGFRFYDLTECSPQQEKTKRECAKAIRCMLRHPILCEELKQNKKLPIKTLAIETKVPRKTLDRYRKYLIMATLVLDGDYPQIAEYLRFVQDDEPA